MVAEARLEGEALFDHPLAAAVIDVIVERGFGAAGAEEMAERAGVSLAEFDRLFADTEDAAAKVFGAYAENYKRRAGRAFATEARWPDNLRAAAYETVRWILEHPAATRYGMVSSLEAGEGARLTREQTFQWCAALIDQGRVAAPQPDAVPEGAPLLAIGAVIELLARRMQGTLDADYVEMVPQLMYGAVRPYLGEEAARAELAIPPPPDLRN
jgi:AcrR family transcriptional regulator